ncbi:phosphatase PAP2 family protein [Amycolatopsis acidiphila]|uniref:Phosphatase PAP2 family protein n=1 Tax=Amycolatopsis acidiphila TaxID=715473 RepID=A0A557ZVZ5_9PSEU|nr:phosphatase PAP2 family protein [Amycolatopsis acidiphila]TVT16175.1 phosphatase PAP2 family protein [Amycolatopsis acidiphila]UIJ58054.1 phosphatase PAP2 family protein [Amycolatopsis acidiphila]
MRARAGIAVAAAVVVLVLGLWPPPVLERGVGDGTHRHTLLDLLVLPTEPYVLIPVIAVTAGVCALRKRGPATALTLAGTTVPVALNTWVLKPLFGHPLHDYLAYPSGHAVSLVSTLTVLVLLARQRLLAAMGAVAVAVAAGAGLVGLGYHYPNDVVGGACFAVAAVLTLSLATRRGRAPSDDSPRAGTSSGNPPAASPP